MSNANAGGGSCEEYRATGVFVIMIFNGNFVSQNCSAQLPRLALSSTPYFACYRYAALLTNRLRYAWLFYS